MKHTIIGTAGHIDHGKTMLLKALTDIDADRLPEEKLRGMTIDLGYVFYGPDVSIIDVPGHEKFIKNMLAGITTIDSVILVIAADDGIMSQTREHFDILRLLDVRRGIIALTKIDLVDRDWLELVKEEVSAFVAGTLLKDAPVVCLSSRTGEGIAEFRAVLEQEIREAPARDDKGIFRYWIDRSFVLKGIGNVVTGTVLAGSLRAGDRLELLPRGREVRARKIQVHNEEVAESGVGQRAAINLTGVERDEVERGDMLASPGYFSPTCMVNARLYLLESAQPLKNRTRIRLHLGCRELLARVVPLVGKAVAPGEATVVQFRLEEPVAADTGDRFIIRSYSPPVTIGGGTILEVHPEKLKYLGARDIQQLEELEQAGADRLILHHLASTPLAPKTTGQLSRALALPENRVRETVEQLLGEGVLTGLGRKTVKAVMLTGELEKVCRRAVEYLESFHEQNPYLNGIKQSELKSKLLENADSAAWEVVLRMLTASGQAVLRGEAIALEGHAVEFSVRDREPAAGIEDLYSRAGFTTPSLRDVAGRFQELGEQRAADIVRGLIEMGRLVEIMPEADKRVIFHRSAVEKAEKVLVELLRQNGEIRVSEFREKIGCSRKYATPLLIHFDQRGLTERSGNIRRLRET
ncbi:MAG: selenocysteine-specific translation elongation factor [Candidatus Glassbacteria bacterium]|nr:selenocysteine-specific translation elongation factor [Candidatus Glassbacteria bacterium]